MRIGAQDGSPVIVNGPLIEAGANSGGFVLAFGEDAESARLLSDAQSNGMIGFLTARTGCRNW